MPTAVQRRDALRECATRSMACTRCPALVRARTRVVPGDGPARADLLLVGEAPDRDEERLGTLFVGRTGRLLDELLEGIGLSRAEVHVCDLVRCLPPDNREPQPTEVANCREYLERTVEIVQPLVVCPLGHAATRALRGDRTPLARVRGRAEVHTIGTRAVRVVPLLHPAAALYRPETVEQLRRDVATLPALLALPAPDQPGGPGPDPPSPPAGGPTPGRDDPPAQLSLL